MSTAPAVTATQPAWLITARFLAAALLIWAAFHFLVATLVRPSGLDRPIALATPSSPLGGVAVAALFTFGAYIAALIAGGDFRRALMAVGLGAAIWAAERGGSGGTITTWLILRNEVPGPPRGAPYALLLVDYVYLILGVTGAAISSFFALHAADARNAIKSALGADRPGGLRDGATALLVTCVTAAIAMTVLVGPPTNEVLRGQVYFAVAVSLYAGVYVAQQFVKSPPPLWLAAAPLVLGVVGLVVAAVRPGLMVPAAYQHLDTLPAWALVRPLPIEFVSAGLIAALAPLKPRTA